MTQPAILEEEPDFSLVLGGPLYQIFRRAHLSGSTLELLRRRMLVLCGLAWLPLLLLSAAAGQSLGGGIAIPFLYDIEANVRFLVAMPILIGAELIVHLRLRPAVAQFVQRRIVTPEEMPKFREAIDRTMRLRNSVVAEVALIVLVYTVGLWVWKNQIALGAASWYATPDGAHTRLTPAGFWYAFVSVPIFQFILVRWYFRLFIWSRFLWQVSRIELSIVPTHPDRVGGLGFLANTVYAFMPLALAHGAMLAGPIANRILYLGAALPEWKVEIGVLVVFLLCLVLGPLLVFAPQLAQAKRTGNREYGTLAERYVREFDAKWLRGGAPADEPLVGSADIQSLADLANSFEVVRTMHIAPITRDSLLRLVAATLVPIVPLALTMMPFEELLRKLLGVLF